ncbi:MAG TPA: hypothetical protein VIY48_22450, partial [Candidatus Paceibacterota bacterium]
SVRVRTAWFAKESVGVLPGMCPPYKSFQWMDLGDVGEIRGKVCAELHNVFFYHRVFHGIYHGLDQKGQDNAPNR